MILVFGSGGQLGQELVEVARCAGLDAIGMPRTQVDITNRADVEICVRNVGPSIVVNAGAYTNVDRAENEEGEAFRANATGPEILALACAAADVPLVHVSTDYVFDGAKTSAYRETDPVAPLTAYGRSKAAGEEAIRHHLPRHVILRTSWVYGTRGANFLKTIVRLANERDEMRIVADQRGCPTWTADLAEAILSAARQIEGGRAAYGTYHFAGLGATTWHEFASHVVDVQGRYTGRFPRVIPIRTAEYPSPAARPVNSELDSSRFAEIFGYTARPWREAVELVIGKLYPSNQANCDLRHRSRATSS